MAHKLVAFQKRASVKEDLEDPRKKLAKIDRDLDAVVNLLIEKPTSARLLDRLDDLEAEKAELEEKIAMDDGKARRMKLLTSEEFMRNGLQIFLNKLYDPDDVKTAGKIIDSFVRKVVKTDKKILIELNVSGLDPLEIEDLSVFVSNKNWWR